jgi:hypothetical protein
VNPGSYNLIRLRFDAWASNLPEGQDMTDILPFDEQGDNFEGSGQENGTRFWYART